MEQFKDSPDSGLACLVIISSIFGLPADTAQLRHQFGISGKKFTSSEIIRSAKSLGLKAKEITSDWSRLVKAHLPAIARHHDRHFFIITKVKEEQALIHDPLEGRPVIVDADQLKKNWDGQLILITKRAGIPGEIRKFDFSWFVPFILKYKKLLGEVIAEAHRVLKNGRKLTLMFNSLDDETWISVIQVMNSVGFRLGKIETLSYSSNSVVQDNRETGLKTDFVLTYQKTRSRVRKISLLNGSAGERRLTELVTNIHKKNNTAS